VLAALRAALDGLPDRERRVLQARFMEGRSAEDLARDAGCTPRAINALCLQARKRLRKRLARYAGAAAELL
jgi:RNA polymerase sigma factor (sigma-70 family)